MSARCCDVVKCKSRHYSSSQKAGCGLTLLLPKPFSTSHWSPPRALPGVLWLPPDPQLREIGRDTGYEAGMKLVWNC